MDFKVLSIVLSSALRAPIRVKKAETYFNPVTLYIKEVFLRPLQSGVLSAVIYQSNLIQWVPFKMEYLGENVCRETSMSSTSHSYLLSPFNVKLLVS